MADQFVKDLLRSWKLEDLIPKFEENKITEDILKQLTKEFIKELIPVIGYRVTFINRWKETFFDNSDEEQNINRNMDATPLHGFKRFDKKRLSWDAALSHWKETAEYFRHSNTKKNN